MAQIKIYALRTFLDARRAALSDAIHHAVTEALAVPADKRFHRFFPLSAEDFVFPADRSERYTILEISMFEGRTAAAKKSLLRLLSTRLEERCGIAPQDLEITIFETPRASWSIRGLPGDELALPYKVEV
jgi:phenylpyruvate tautomerase PptA (4-oxalocrotonate tautomerase family)